MLSIILAGPGGNWSPLLIPLIAVGALIIGGNALYLRFKNRHSRHRDQDMHIEEQ